KLSGPMAIPPMALACAAPASESLIPMAANPGDWPLPRVSASPGLEAGNNIGTVAPMASSTAIWLVDMRDLGTPLRLVRSDAPRTRSGVPRRGRDAERPDGQNQGYPASTPASNYGSMSCACHDRQQLCRRRCMAHGVEAVLRQTDLIRCPATEAQPMKTLI